MKLGRGIFQSYANVIRWATRHYPCMRDGSETRSYTGNPPNAG
jgi:hypothetical protein